MGNPSALTAAPTPAAPTSFFGSIWNDAHGMFLAIVSWLTAGRVRAITQRDVAVGQSDRARSGGSVASVDQKRRRQRVDPVGELNRVEVSCKFA